MVDTLLDFKSKTDQIFNGPFRKDQSMGFALRDGFEVFINKRQNKPAEMLGQATHPEFIRRATKADGAFVHFEQRNTSTQRCAWATRRWPMMSSRTPLTECSTYSISLKVRMAVLIGAKITMAESFAVLV